MLFFNRKKNRIGKIKKSKPVKLNIDWNKMMKDPKNGLEVFKKGLRDTTIAYLDKMRTEKWYLDTFKHIDEGLVYENTVKDFRLDDNYKHIEVYDECETILKMLAGYIILGFSYYVHPLNKAIEMNYTLKHGTNMPKIDEYWKISPELLLKYDNENVFIASIMVIRNITDRITDELVINSGNWKFAYGVDICRYCFKKFDELKEKYGDKIYEKGPIEKASVSFMLEDFNSELFEKIENFSIYDFCVRNTELYKLYADLNTKNDFVFLEELGENKTKVYSYPEWIALRVFFNLTGWCNNEADFGNIFS